VDEAIHEATLTWNTAEGFATLERWIVARRAAAVWTGERRHEWQTPKQLVALVKAAIRQAVKDGILPLPNDYCLTWDGGDSFTIHTLHSLVRCDTILEIANNLLKPFVSSVAGE
jgi:hypothetical protein